jgi:hypothetical protein
MDSNRIRNLSANEKLKFVGAVADAVYFDELPKNYQQLVTEAEEELKDVIK